MSNRKLAPILEPKLKRLKKKPRGKSFEKGNTYGADHRFGPGNNANPGGRPASAKISEAMRALLAAKVTDKFEIRTNAELIALKILLMGKRGNIAAIREAADRAEGRPAFAVSVLGGGDNLTALIACFHEQPRRIGPPEGMHVRKKELTNGQAQVEATEV